VWWDYPVLTEGDWDQLSHLSKFVADIDFANLPFKPLSSTASGADIYVMGTGKEAFGWVRTFEKEDISGSELLIHGLADGSCKVAWYDTWNGKVFQTKTEKPEGGNLNLTVPKLPETHADVAFKIREK